MKRGKMNEKSCEGRDGGRKKYEFTIMYNISTVHTFSPLVSLLPYNTQAISISVSIQLTSKYAGLSSVMCDITPAHQSITHFLPPHASAVPSGRNVVT